VYNGVMTASQNITEVQPSAAERELFDEALLRVGYLTAEERDRLQGITPFHVIRTVAWLWRSNEGRIEFNTVVSILAAAAEED